MSLFNQISFPSNDPVTGQPTVDGWTGNEDAGVATTQAEPGFAVADRVTFGGGNLYPPVVMQCELVTNPSTPVVPGSPPRAPDSGSYLAFSFFCSLDVSWDFEDFIAVALSVPTEGGTDQRLIIIQPSATGVGAGDPADTVYTTLAGTPVGDDYHVRLDKAPRALHVYAGQSGNWTLIDNNINTNNLTARACSWMPAVPDVTDSGPTSQTIPGTGTFSFSVASTAGFHSGGGEFVIAGQPIPVSYVGITGNTFTGCTGGGAGTVAPHTAIRHADVGWSVELLVPTAANTGTVSFGSSTPPWINIPPSFGLYMNVCRFGRTSESGGTPAETYYSTQYVFPDPGDGSNFIRGSLGAAITINTFGTGLIPDFESPPGSNLGAGVRFQNQAAPVLSVGVRQNATSGTLGDLIEGPSGTADNFLVAQIENTDPNNAANGVSVEFRFANWGTGPAVFPAWAPAQGATGPTPPTINIPPAPHATTPALAADIVWSWPHASVPSVYNDSPHQCMWVRLNSANPVNFVQGGVRRNMNFEHLSAVDRTAALSGKGHPRSSSAGKHSFVLTPHVRVIHVAQQPIFRGAEATNVHSVWLWLVDAARRTGQTITIGKKTAEILDPTPGQFSLVLTHDVPQDVLTFGLGGGGLKPGRGGSFTVDVPHDGTTHVQAVVKAAPPHPGPPPTIKLGDHGDNVARCQFLLSVTGYGVGPAQIDGTFGPGLRSVVESFQRALALTVDGIVGPATWTALLARAPVQADTFPMILSPGASGGQVQGLQRRLSQNRQWFARWAPALGLDGQFGPATEQLVQALQRWAHLKADGTAGYGTWAASSGPSLWEIAGAQAPGQPFPVPPPVQEGSHGEPAQQAQFLLGNEGYGLAPWQADGNFGPDSKAAVERFQKANRLAVDGVVGPATWTALIKGAPVAQHPVPPTIQAGSSGPIVTLLQRTLNDARSRFGATLPPLAADGHFGPSTETLVRALQQWGAVIVDGIVSYRTWSVAIGPSLWSQ